MKRSMRLSTCLAALALVEVGSAQVFMGLTDDFQDGTLMGWGGASPQNIPTGGPVGAGDRFLRVTGDGSGLQGGVPATFNTDTRWGGNYAALGSVLAIRVHARNESSVQLHLRLVLHSVGLTDRWTSNTAFIISPGTGWRTIDFAIGAGFMTQVQGSNPFSFTATNVETITIRHQAGAPSPGGTPLAGSLGLDNIKVVPEPATILVIACGVAMVSRRRR